MVTNGGEAAEECGDQRAYVLDLRFSSRLEPTAEMALDAAVRETRFAEVNLNYRIWYNRGAGGAGLVLAATLIAEEVAAGLISKAVIAGFKKAYAAVRDKVVLPRLTIKARERPAVTYQLHPPQSPDDLADQLDAALDAIPADFEITRTESVKVWKDGRWERVVTERTRGGP